MIDCLRYATGTLQMPTVDVRIAAKVFVSLVVVQAGVEIAGVIMKTSLVPQVRCHSFEKCHPHCAEVRVVLLMQGSVSLMQCV